MLWKTSVFGPYQPQNLQSHSLHDEKTQPLQSTNSPHSRKKRLNSALPEIIHVSHSPTTVKGPIRELLFPVSSSMPPVINNVKVLEPSPGVFPVSMSGPWSVVFSFLGVIRRLNVAKTHSPICWRASPSATISGESLLPDSKSPQEISHIKETLCRVSSYIKANLCNFLTHINQNK